MPGRRSDCVNTLGLEDLQPKDLGRGCSRNSFGNLASFSGG
jgi:hypothetical protein